MHVSVRTIAATFLCAALPAFASAQPVMLGAPVAVAQAPPQPGAAAAAPAAGAPAPAAPANWSGSFDDRPAISQRWSIRRDFGDGIGYDSGYTYVEGFIPVVRGDGSIGFANVRVVNFDQSQLWEFQGGGGARWMFSNVVAGLNAFYDGRNNPNHWYGQAGFGWELLGRCWEARGNFYVPVGPQRFQIAQSPLFNPRFVNTNIAVSQTSVFESSLGGLDTEVGRVLPNVLTDKARTMAFLGYYHYDNENVRSINGVRARLETWVGETLSLHLAVQNDNVNDTTVTGGLALHYGGVRRGFRREDPLAAKLGNRVVRDPNVVLQQTGETRDQLLIDPATGKPIEVRHANSSAAAGGDGSVERPVQTLAQLQSVSGPQQILFLHANSVFNGQNIVLQNNQRMLGEGIDHIVVATQGTYLLPRATSGTILPIIQNSPGSAAITLASNVEVSGLQILSPNLTGIFGSGVSNVNLNRNVITDVKGFGEGDPAIGISLNNVGGVNYVQNNVLSTTIDNSMTAINVAYDGANQGTLYVTGNAMSSTTFMSGISFFNVGTSNVLAYVNRNSFSLAEGNSGSGLFVLQGGSSTGTYQVALNQFGAGDVDIFSSGSATLNLQLLSNNANAFSLSQFLTSKFTAENTLETNVPAPTTFGTITVVPFGTFGFPPP